MAHITADRVKETTTVVGTGDATLLGAASGFLAFSAVMANADTCWYCIAGQSGAEWEVGLGTWATGGTLTRTTILKSSNANAAVTFSVGTKDVFITVPADKLLELEPSGATLFPVVSADPAIPASGNAYYFFKTVCGRSMPKWMPPSGIDNCVQPALFQNSFFIVQPGTGTAPTVLGGSLTSVVTLSHPAVAATTFGAVTNFASAATANATTGTGSALAPYCLTNAAGYCGGFFMVQRLSFPDANYGATTTGSRFFVGMTDQTMAVSVGADNPAGSRIGFAFSTVLSETNFMLTTKNGTTETRVSTGMALTIGKLYDFFLWTAPAASGNVVYWRITNITNNVTVEGSTSATLPAVTTFLRVGFQLATLTTTARNIRMKKIYVETDL